MNEDHRILAELTRRNKQTAGAWDRFAYHRAQVMSLLVPTPAAEHRDLCLLGAGNCNDFDLAELAASYEQITLIDLDEQAMLEGVSRQLASAPAKEAVKIRGHIDLTGIADRLAGWSPQSPPDDETARQACGAVLETPLDFAPAASFDVVASTVVLTQLIDLVGRSIGEQHPHYLELVQAVRFRHLQAMLEALRPGGTGVLVTDVVSSDSLEVLKQTSPEQLPGLVGQAIEARNFFTGVNPAVLRGLLEGDGELAPLVKDVRAIAPWHWDFGLRVYAVYAIRFTKKQPMSESRSSSG